MFEFRIKRVSVILAAFLVIAAPVLCPLAAAQEASAVSVLQEYKGYLRQGDRGDAVRALQEVLSALGYYPHYIDGVFGPKTKEAVLEFQDSVGLRTDGIVGPATISELDAEYLKKYPPETHVVRSGETLSGIAAKYGVKVSFLQEINGLKSPDRIYAGQILTVKAQATPVPTVEEPPVTAPVPEEPQFPVPDKSVCLTFNDGPDPSTTGPILATLDKYGIKATFFVIGEKAEMYPELVREMAARGHTVAVHGYEHKVLAGLPAKEVEADLKKACSVIASLTGAEPYLYRPPGGALDATQVREATKLGLRVMMWTNIGGADLGAQDPAQVVSRVVESAKDGAIILLHDGLPNTALALPGIIESLARLGYGFRNPSSLSGVSSQ
ncbi:MAG TPA: polysaccharide deacetylase family protein [Firmicutes bacterium]|nr:polysaccharide deacetylase family protein [Candidatus Fermentithermobacillaceae bacterium]